MPVVIDKAIKAKFETCLNGKRVAKGNFSYPSHVCICDRPHQFIDYMIECPTCHGYTPLTIYLFGKPTAEAAQ